MVNCLQVLLFVLIGCQALPDNPIEEAIEAKIKDYTGVDVDFTSEDGQ